jgi:predicted nucleic acid-binding protein
VKGIVLDASVAVSWCFVDEVTDYAEAVLSALRTRTALVPAIWALEVTNAVLAAQRAKRVKPQEIRLFVDLLGELSIIEYTQPVGDALSNVLPLAQEHGLTAYDASYMDLAARQGVPLASFDGKLQRACRAAGVEIFVA